MPRFIQHPETGKLIPADEYVRPGPKTHMIMPDIGGKDAYDGLKKIDPNVKVLLSSGYSLNAQAQEILEKGCNGFIQKPFDMQQLAIKIREILET